MNSLVKFKQIEVCRVDNNKETQTDALIYALSEDGEVWISDMYNKTGWEKLNKFR